MKVKPNELTEEFTYKNKMMTKCGTISKKEELKKEEEDASISPDADLE